METLLSAFGTMVGSRQTQFELCDLITVRVTLKLGDLKGDGEFKGPLSVVRSGLGHKHRPLWSRVLKLSGNFGFTTRPIGWLSHRLGRGRWRKAF